MIRALIFLCIVMLPSLALITIRPHVQDAKDYMRVEGRAPTKPELDAEFEEDFNTQAPWIIVGMAEGALAWLAGWLHVKEVDRQRERKRKHEEDMLAGRI